MARHIMAVCVVCLLCVEHVPCEDHIDSFTPVTTNLPFIEEVFQNDHIINKTDDDAKTELKRHENADPGVDITIYNTTKLLTKVSKQKVASRRRRHAEHNSQPEITNDFLHLLLHEYGQDDGTIVNQEFERMLTTLGLHKMLRKESNESCAQGSQILAKLKTLQHDPQCERVLPSTKIPSCWLDEHDLINLCPILLYQLASPKESERAGCVNNAYFENLDDDEDEEGMVRVWAYAFIAVTACGLLGLIGVAIIPCMDSRYYKHILQYLGSLAVGTMTGDALLHLLPHSLAEQSETEMVYKGLTCMGGIVFFYITEHGFTMISEWRKTIAKKDKQTSRAKVVRDPESSINNSVAGDKLCKSKYSSYPYCYDEIAMDTKNDVWLHLPNAETNDNTTNKSHTNNKENCDGNETGQSLLSQNYTPISDMNHRIPGSNTISTNLDDNSLADGGATGGYGKDKALVKNETVTVILREHESSHHGHSHKHGHVHSPPETLSAVAWMIIMGDGLHNFTDGMAIGAAFAENIAGGCSTSLAVFCHELPHELGDFAILIKAGMSVKSAVYYNLLTGILSYIGMVCGIVFGQSHDAAQWMFAAAAGLFIYIALVDMVPELSHKTIEQFALQIFGITTGVLIMLLIAINENRLMNLFTPSSAIVPHQVYFPDP